MKRHSHGTYSDIPGDFYYKSTRSPNPISNWYHANRSRIIHDWVAPLYPKCGRIIDLGCGSASWNTGMLPVFGVDINRKLLSYGKARGFLSGYESHDVEEPLPARWSGSFGVVVISEVLEHVRDPAALLAQANRLLADGGYLAVTVPFDTGLSTWRYLFLMQCVLQGHVLGKAYYKQKCGHINSFSPSQIVALSERAGFKVVEIKTSKRMNIALLCRKIHAPRQ